MLGRTHSPPHPARPRLRRPRAGTVLALVALVLAVGGVAHAAPRITGDDIVDGSLEQIDLAAASVGATQIADHQVTLEELATGAVGAVALRSEVRDIDPPRIPAHGCADAGGFQSDIVVSGQPVLVLKRGAPLPAGVFIAGAISVSRQFFTVRFCNLTGAAQDPAAGSYAAMPLL